MDEREELQALRRLAELEAKAGGNEEGGAGAGRGSVNPPLAADRRELGVGQGLARGAVRGAGQVAKGLGILVSGPVERVLHATNSPHEGKMFKAAEEFGEWGNKAAELKPGETYSTPGKIAETVGEGAPILAGAITGGPAAAGVIAGGSGAANTFAEGIRANLNTAANVAKTTIAGVGGALSGYLPGSLGVGLPAKVATGAGINVGAGEVQRQAGNVVNEIAGRPELNQEFSPEAAAGQAIVGGTLATAPHAIPATAKVAGKAAKAVTPIIGAAGRKVLNVDPELAKVAQIASELKHPIDVRPDQVIENAKFSKLAGQAASDVPLANSKANSNQVAYTRNLIDLLNPEEVKAERLTSDVFDQAMRRSGEGIGEITARTPVPEADIAQGLESVHKGLSKATEDNRRIVTEYLDDVQRAADENGGVIDGTRLKEINSEIGKQARRNSDNDLGRYLNDVQDVIQESVERNARPEDIQPLRDFRRQYAYGKMVEPLIADTIDGKISPQKLMARVNATKQGKHYMARSMGGPIGDLAKVGQLIKEPGSSLTTERSLVYGLGLGGGAYIEPHVAASAYGGALAYNTLGPKLTRAMIGKRPAKAAPPTPSEPPVTPPTAGGARPTPEFIPQGPVPEWDTASAPAVAPRETAAGGPPEPGKGGGGGAPPAPTDPRLAEIGRLRTQATSDVVRKALDDQVAVVQKDIAAEAKAEKARVDAGELRRAANDTADPALKAALRAKAEKLAADEKIPVGEVREGQPAIAAGKPAKVPVGATKEGQPEIKTEAPGKIPVGKTYEIEAEYIEAEKAWRKDHGLGNGDAGRAAAVADALAVDEKAVERAAAQHENSPRAFDREIERIKNEGAPDEAGASGRQEAAGTPVKREAPIAQFRRDAAEIEKSLPAVPEGHTRLWRGNRPGDVGKATQFTNDMAGIALPFRKAYGGELSYVDVPSSALTDYLQTAGAAPNAEFNLPATIAARAQVVKRKGAPDANEGKQAAGSGTGDAGENPVERNPPAAVSAAGERSGADSTGKAGAAGGEAGAAGRQEATGAVETRVATKGPSDVANPKPDDQPGGVQPQAGEKGVPEGAAGKAPEGGPEEIFKEGPVDRQLLGTPEALHTALTDKLGAKIVEGLQEQGVLRYASAAEEGRHGNVKAMLSESRSGPAATLYFDRLSAADAPAVLMHELGEHFGIVRLLGDQRYKTMLGELRDIRDTPEVREAWREVKRSYTGEDTVSRLTEGNDTFLREVAAHLVEKHPDLPFVRRLINEIRAYFYEHFGTTMGNRVDANLIRGLAASALRKASTGDLPNMHAPVRMLSLKTAASPSPRMIQ